MNQLQKPTSTNINPLCLFSQKFLKKLNLEVTCLLITNHLKCFVLDTSFLWLSSLWLSYLFWTWALLLPHFSRLWDHPTHHLVCFDGWVYEFSFLTIFPSLYTHMSIVLFFLSMPFTGHGYTVCMLLEKGINPSVLSPTMCK